IVRALLVGSAVALWFLCAVLAVALLWYGPKGSAEDWTGIYVSHAIAVIVNPRTIVCTLALAALAAWVERRLENAPEFPLGLLIGVVTVLLTVALNAGVLLAGSAE